MFFGDFWELLELLVYWLFSLAIFEAFLKYRIVEEYQLADWIMYQIFLDILAMNWISILILFLGRLIVDSCGSLNLEIFLK